MLFSAYTTQLKKLFLFALNLSRSQSDMAHKEQAGRKRRSSEMSRVRVARRYSMLIVVNFVLRCTRRASRGEKNEPLRVCATPCQVGAFFYYNAHENFPFLL